MALIRLSLLLALLGPLPAFAGPTHAPMRPLPTATSRPLAKGPTFFVDAARGNDQADGSEAKPWKSIQHGVRRLKPGATLYLRGGVYHEKVVLTRSGTAEAPIVIASYPGELAVVDGGLKEFLESPATSWEPLPGGAEGEYVSTKTYAHVDDRRMPQQFLPAAWEPMWGIEDERPLALGHFADSMVPLHGYRALTDLRSTNELSLGDRKKAREAGVYCGPGLWFNRDTGRIHVRLAPHRLAGLGDRAYRGETDPRKLPLVVALGFGDAVLRVNGVRHVKIEGIVFRGATGSPMIEVYGSEDIHLDHLTVFGGFPGLLVNASKNIRVTHCAFRGLAAPWSGRAHMKYYGTASYQIVFQNNQPLNENIELAFCEFTDDHDCAFLRYVKNLKFHHNFVDNFNDDGLECGPKLRGHTIYIYQNRIGACLGVFQQHEIDKDESPLEHDAKSGVFIYRNVIDQRAGVYYQLPAQPDPSGAFLRAEGHLISDHGSPIYPVMRVYHNTLLRHTPVFRDYFLFGLGAASLRNTERDVFNNAFVQTERVPGAVILGKEAGRLREGGNLLWGLDGGANPKGDPIAKFRASKLFAASKEHYAPGWTTHDRVADPRFVKLPADAALRADLRLQKGSPAIDGGQPIPADWPDPLRDADQGAPDIGAIPHAVEVWGVGVDGRIPLFGGGTRDAKTSGKVQRDHVAEFARIPVSVGPRTMGIGTPVAEFARIPKGVEPRTMGIGTLASSATCVRVIELDSASAQEKAPLEPALSDMKLLEPVWSSPVVHRESSVLLQVQPDGPLTARLAFPADAILEVATADRRHRFDLAKDVKLSGDGLTLTVIHPGPIEPIKTADFFPPKDAPNSYRHRAGHPEQNLLYRPGRWFHDRNIEITYRRRAAATPPPKIVEGTLPKTLARLKAGSPLTLGISGDSISTGLDASALTKAPPHQPGYPDLVAAQLRATFKSQVLLKNRAVGGWSVAHGVSDLEKLLAEKPHLIVVAYGMNDVGRRDPKWFGQETSKILARIRAADPDIEVVLVSPMLGHAEWVYTPREMFAKYRDELRARVGPGVALADVTALWELLLRNKHDLDLTGNGLNHPNDFGHRVYAQAILALLVTMPEQRVTIQHTSLTRKLARQACGA